MEEKEAMIDYTYLRPKKAEALKKWHNGVFHERTDLSWEEYDNAVILPIRRVENETLQFGHGGVIANGQYMESSGIEGRVGGYYPFQGAVIRDETVVYCGYLVPQWGHFLIEGVSRLWYCLANPQDVDKYVFITRENESTEVKGNYREFLDLLGILDKVEIINHPVEYRKVYVPELGYSRKYYYSEQYRGIFVRVVERALERCSLFEPSERVFLSRGRFTKAKGAEAGLEMLDHYFEKNGYKILYPELLSLTDLVFYLQNAKICAAESGTVPHNFLFAQQGKQCIIVERQTTVNEIQANIDIIKVLSVIYIDGHYTIYPVNAGYGPYCMAYNHCFQQFTKEHQCSSPDTYYVSHRYLRKCLKHYMKAYRDAYQYRWGLEPWMMMYADAIYEAYQDTLADLDDYLSGRKPFLPIHYLQLRYWKQAIKAWLFK